YTDRVERLERNTVMGGRGAGRSPAQAKHQLDVVAQPIGAWTVTLVDDEDVGDLHHAGLERLDRIARFGNEHDDRSIRSACDVELGLPHAHRLDDDSVEAERIEH